MNDAEKLIEVLKEVNVPHEVNVSNNFVDVVITANASDKYVVITFKDGKFSYSN